MILLNVEKADKDLVPRKAGATWDSNITNPYRTGYNKGCWKMSNDVCGNLYKFKRWLVPTQITLGDMCDSLNNSVTVDRQVYTFKADVNNTYPIENNSFCMLTLITDHNINRSIKAKVPREVLGDMECKDFMDKEVEVTGAVYLYAPYNELQFEVTNIKVIGPCTRLVDYEKWRSENLDILEEKTVPPTWDKLINKVGLIANIETEGYYDFVAKLDKRIPDENVFLKDVKLRLDDMIQAIQELNEEAECDVICIVRGGGNPENLIDFSRPELLKAIHESKIPVITGVGHVSYKLLCNEAAFWHTDTPTAAATYINNARKQFFSEKISQKNARVNQVINKQTTKHLKEIVDWKDKYSKAEEEISALKKINDDLMSEKRSLKAQIDELQKKLDSASSSEPVKEKKGFFSKIFG